MYRRYATMSAAVLAMVAWTTQAQDAVKSGPQAGQDVPGAFHPLNVTGEYAGKKHCLFCQAGDGPVALVFARTNNPMTVKLLSQLDEATVKNQGNFVASFAVFCSDASGLADSLKETASKVKLKELVLSIDNPTGPSKYNVAKDADVTVVLYKDRKVISNFAFRAGQMQDADVTRVVETFNKIASAK